MTINTMTLLEKRLVSIQQKLEHLNAEVASIVALANSSQSTNDKQEGRNPMHQPISSPSKKSQIGINRYRQLQANS